MDAMHWTGLGMTTWHTARFAIVSIALVGAIILIWLWIAAAPSALALRSLAGGNGETHIILQALGAALFFATLWSALQFEGTPPE